MNRTDLQLRAPMAPLPGARPPPRQRLPAHCRASARLDARVVSMQRMLRELSLATVCEEARCPNRNQCFSEGTATFMLLGSVCTRTCRFCNVATGRPAALDQSEPERVATAVARLAQRHAVVTSVNRDDLNDGGAEQFAATIHAIRGRSAETTIEVLTPDFQGLHSAIDRVSAAAPEIYNHNLETVPRLYRQVRPAARYRRSLELLARVKRRNPALLTKSGLMLGLGEEISEVESVLRDLRSVDVDCLSLGQYLRPTPRHVAVSRYVPPDEFDEYRDTATRMGFLLVSSSPLTRSSYHADEDFQRLRAARAAG